MNRMFSLPHCGTVVPVPTIGRVDMNITTLLSFHFPNRIPWLDHKTFLIHTWLQTLINSSHLDPNLFYLYKLYHMQVSCIWSSTFIITNYSDAECQSSMYNSLNSIWIFIQSGCIAFTTAFCVFGRCQDCHWLKSYAHFSLINMNVLDKILSMDALVSMKKSILHSLGLLLLCWLTAFYYDLLVIPSSLNDISFPGMNVCLAALVRYLIANLNWWHLSPSFLVPISGWNEAHIWTNLERDIYCCVQEGLSLISNWHLANIVEWVGGYQSDLKPSMSEDINYIFDRIFRNWYTQTQ